MAPPLRIAVCVKRVAEASEAEFEVDAEGRLRARGLVYDINEWDDYALEEALRMKESLGGEVVVFTVGGPEDEEVLRKCLAKGADEAVRIDAPGLSDPLLIAELLSAAISRDRFDLILAGAQASDDGYAAVPSLMASLMALPFATLVKRVEIRGSLVVAHRELEGGVEEVVELSIPALLSIQSGINEPRYVSIMGLRRASKKPIKVLSLEELKKTRPLPAAEERLKVVGYEIPSSERRAQLLEGPADKAAEAILRILKERGILA
ncbi:MAG: electron transfer flavoprotein subunit beta/FixA family protein [Candidatus Nezhaarchaeales archaeon]